MRDSSRWVTYSIRATASSPKGSAANRFTGSCTDRARMSASVESYGGDYPSGYTPQSNVTLR
jgi:hypothetical protein